MSCSICGNMGHNRRTCDGPVGLGHYDPKGTWWRLYIDYNEEITGGGPVEGEEDAEWPTLEPEFKTVEFRGVYRSMKDENAPFFKHSEPVSKETYESETVFLVIVFYDTGNTFGRRNGEWYLEGIYFDFNEALKVSENIENDTYVGHKPWQGFFERYSRVDVREFRVHDKYVKNFYPLQS